MKTRLIIGGSLLALTFGAGVIAQDLPPVRLPPPPPGYVPGGPLPGLVPTVPEAIPPEEPAPEAPAPVSSTANIVEPIEQAATPKAPAKPLPRPRFAAAVLQAVDKVTAETLRFEAKLNEPLRYKGLLVTVHACESTASDEGFQDSLAHMEVQSEPETFAGRAPQRVIYRGWMSGGSPGLHPLEHPTYDLWLIACKTAAPST